MTAGLNGEWTNGPRRKDQDERTKTNGPNEWVRPRHEFEQRGLAAPVWSHERDARVAIHPDVQLVIQVILFLTRVRKRHSVEGKHRGRKLGALGKLKHERVLAKFWFFHRLGFDFGKHLVVAARVEFRKAYLKAVFNSLVLTTRNHTPFNPWVKTR